MKHVILFIIAIFMLTGSVHAAVFPCSGDSSAGMLTCSGCENMGVVEIKAYPSGMGASITFHPGEKDTYTQTDFLSLGDDPGTHTFTISLAGYNDYTGQYQICTGKITYATVQLSPATTPTPTLIYIKPGLLTNITLAPTTTPTTTMTTATTATATATVTGTTAAATAVTTPPTDTATATDTIASRTKGPTTSPTAASPNTGALSVITTPSGAAIYLDGVQRGIAPATIPGLLPGDHTLLLKLDGYSDLTVPVTITAGETQQFTTSLSPATQGQAAANASATKKSPGFAAVIALVALAGAAFIVRKIR